jgi:polyferredoxin
VRAKLDRVGRIFGCAALGAVALLATGSSAQDGPPEADGWGFDDLADVEPTLLDFASDQAWDIGLVAAFLTLATISFLRKSLPLKYATLAICVYYMGFERSMLLTIVNVFGAISGNLPIFERQIWWYLLAGFTALTIVLWGRVYCGRVCAFGALTQLIDAIVPRRFQIELPAVLERRASYIKYVILFGAVGYYLLTTEIAFYRYIEPFWIFTLDATPALWTLLAVVLVASIFVRNLYCRFLCPLGAALGLLSTLTIFKIKRWSECGTCQLCEKECDWGAIRERKIILTECVRCDECEILYASKQRCPHWLLIAKRKRLDAAATEVAVPPPTVRKKTSAP